MQPAFALKGVTLLELLDCIDLHKAWTLVRHDLDHRVFTQSPFHEELVKIELESWINELRARLRAGRYNPTAPLMANVPKARGTVRPGIILPLEDQVVYAACVAACVPAIRRSVGWAENKVDFSYRLSHRNTKWFTSAYDGWTNFRNASLRYIEDGYSYVVIADISAYYENISLERLISDLRQLGVAETLISQLSTCLNRWAICGKGLPQGFSPSDVLAKLYLNSTDKRLQGLRFKHCRYVDDIRMFCSDLAEARKALVFLCQVLRERGLSVQTAKSDIYRSDEARRNIEGIIPILEPLARRFGEEAVQAHVFANPYFDVTDPHAVLSGPSGHAPLETIREAFKSYFIDSDDTRFDKTLLHFLLNRLGEKADRFALDYCKRLLKLHPEETEAVLKYVKELNAADELATYITEFFQSSDAAYPHQKDQIVKWLFEMAYEPQTSLLFVIRDLALDNRQPNYLRAVCRQMLGRYGDQSDLEELEMRYAEAGSVLEKSEIICCLARLEPSRRNSFLTRARNDGELCERAVKWAKTNVQMAAQPA